jgi:phosphatidylglycerophosphatase C
MDLALFDFDGTLTREDTFGRFVLSQLPRRERLIALVRVAPTLLAYRAGMLTGGQIRERAVRHAFTGRDATAVREAGQRYAKTWLPRVLRPDALERLAFHRRRGDEIAVVSASLRDYLEPWSELHGIGLLCNELEERGGKLTGRWVDGDCAGPGKAERVRRRFDLARFGAIYAYGDTVEDRELLALATHPYYRFRPGVP